MIVFKVERQILKLVGSTIRSYNVDKVLVCKAKQKAFKLKEQIVFFADEQDTQPMFSIKARSIIDFSATYDIFANDGVTVIGSMKRDGIASMFVRDEWTVMDAAGQQLAHVAEDSALFGVLRRHVDFVSLFFPQKYEVTVAGQVVGTFQQNKNPLTVRFECEYEDNAIDSLGESMIYAIPNLLMIIEGRQS